MKYRALKRSSLRVEPRRELHARQPQRTVGDHQGREQERHDCRSQLPDRREADPERGQAELGREVAEGEETALAVGRAAGDPEHLGEQHVVDEDAGCRGDRASQGKHRDVLPAVAAVDEQAADE